jgi:hypothetical protein
MGNTHSDVTARVKEQIYADKKSETYKLVDIKGGGELIELMKDPIFTKNSLKLDDAIKKKVFDSLYNEGKGEYVC